LNIAKNDIQTRSRREAASLAALQHDRFVERVMPLYENLLEAMNENKIPRLAYPPEGAVANFDENQLQTPQAQEWLNNAKPLLDNAVTYLNALDAVAVYFMNGIADEELAFPAMGRPFCRQVERVQLILAYHQSIAPHSYDAIISLYNIWKERVNKLHLESQVDALTGRLKDYSDRKIKPIGTD
jgi:hypothetical protein